jgi:hypothetical protein
LYLTKDRCSCRIIRLPVVIRPEHFLINPESVGITHMAGLKMLLSPFIQIILRLEFRITLNCNTDEL